MHLIDANTEEEAVAWKISHAGFPRARLFVIMTFSTRHRVARITRVSVRATPHREPEIELSNIRPFVCSSSRRDKQWIGSQYLLRTHLSKDLWLVIMIASPLVSYCGRPARPKICPTAHQHTRSGQENSIEQTISNIAKIRHQAKSWF